ncbi:MAG: hypothetical protein KGZ40_05020 [Clostridiales bacterium]|nr:hypothetical protein [Clostridiales bacterium]
MFRVHNTIMSLVQFGVVATLLFALSPVCTMPECGGGAEPAGLSHSCGGNAADGPCEDTPGAHPCESYLTAADTPDGIPVPQAPETADFNPGLRCADLALPTYARSTATEVPISFENPSGTRLRI